MVLLLPLSWSAFSSMRAIDTSGTGRNGVMLKKIIKAVDDWKYEAKTNPGNLKWTPLHRKHLWQISPAVERKCKGLQYTDFWIINMSAVVKNACVIRFKHVIKASVSPYLSIWTCERGYSHFGVKVVVPAKKRYSTAVISFSYKLLPESEWCMDEAASETQCVSKKLAVQMKNRALMKRIRSP